MTKAAANQTQALMQRDGSGQIGRNQAALNPDYVSVDERSLKDLLNFAKKYAKELQYFEVNNEHIQAISDWNHFLNELDNLDEVLQFIQNPDDFPLEQVKSYARPHVVLFFTFLQLLQHAHNQLNTFTQRHLDFYYQEVLRATKKPGIPDQVHILLELVPNSEPIRVPAGTYLNVGTDSLGQDRFYSTNNDIVVNHAQIAKLSSVYAEKRITGIREARENHEGTADEAIMQMLQMALGHPLPGDALLPYKTVEQVDYDYLSNLHQFVKFVQNSLFMNFPDLRTLMKFKGQRDNSDIEWSKINQLLEESGKIRTGNPNFQLNPDDPRDFEANLELALGALPNFAGITEVENIYDLYEQRIRKKVEVEAVIREELYFNGDPNDEEAHHVKKFYDMMQIKIRIDGEWREINRLLEKSARKKRQDEKYTLPLENPTNFTENLENALGILTYPSLPGLATITDLDTYYAHFLEVEQYFYITAENFTYFMEVVEKEEAKPKEWDKVYAILAEAHKIKVYTDRKAKLKQIRENQGFEAMLDAAVGEEKRQSSLDSLQILLEYLNENDSNSLREIAEKNENSPETITEDDWNTAYRIVELAQRALFDEPLAQKEEWLNLYPTEDATSINVILGIETDANTPRWKTFGQRQATVSQESLPPTSFGWAITSPLLSLSEGTRTITLTLGFQSHEFDSKKIEPLFSNSTDGGPFCIELSTETGWIEIDEVGITIDEDYQSLISRLEDEAPLIPAIQFKLTLAENVDALAPLLDSPWPALRLMLRQIWEPENEQRKTGRYINHYQSFKELVLLKTHIAVAVSGLTPLLLQNDETPLTPNKPFEPFGSQPVVGSRFYLGHPELTTKKLSKLEFKPEWMGVPDNIVEHYKNYPKSSKLSKQEFTVKISLIDKQLERVLNENASLFGELKIGNTLQNIKRSIAVDTDTFLLNWNRYWQWELNEPDFQHSAYPIASINKSLEFATAIANKNVVASSHQDTVDNTITTTAADYQINPPYTPKIKSLQLEYSASIEVITAEYNLETSVEQIFHIQPFGIHKITPEHAFFLPQYNYEGELYIGIQDIAPPQNLALLFQMAEGSANPDLEPVPIQWHYLSGNRWKNLQDGKILQDSTRGLINSGIIAFSLEPNEPNTLLPNNLYWIRAAIPQHSNSVCDTVDIHTQAVSATFIDKNNAPDHLSRPLPAHSISDLAEPLPQIKGVHQPYTSYGGKMAEQDNTFYRRLSERLRHKQRAITIWDYEHLILERFPEIYKVKCLPATSDKLGEVEIIVIPEIKNKLPFNPFEPKASANLIADIKDYVVDTMPGFATVTVKNAHYVPVKVRFAVRFLPGYNEGYYKKQLNQSINRFLSPWAYEEGADITIGGRIYANVIINFIEEQFYVDYVTNIKLFSSLDSKTFKLAPAGWVEAEQPDVVLVAARQHEIDTISDINYEEKNFEGINYMRIELDFIVG